MNHATTVWVRGSRNAVWLAAISACAVVLAGCGEAENKYVPPPPPEVTVGRPVQKPITEHLEFTGNTQAFEKVDLEARVEGFLMAYHFKDGDIVKKDQLLFTIEQGPYQAKVKLQEATLAANQARLLRSGLEYNRQLQLIKQNATSQATVEQWQSERDAAQAAVEEAKANLDLARINLSYTLVRAPFHGRIDRHLVDPGNLVGSGKPTQLATIYRIDPIYAYFNMNERDLVRVLERERSKKAQGLDKTGHRDEGALISLGIEGEQGFPHEGRLDFAATSLDANTGTLLLRGIFDNPIAYDPPMLLPGMFVRVQIPVRVKKHAVLVPERAIGVDQGGRYVLVVGAQDVVEQRPVSLGVLEDGWREVRDGLQLEDEVIVAGIQRARPGAKVRPVRQQEAAPADQPAGGGAGHETKP
jgi:membrane fusion protein, multidrug efflux system